MLRSADTAATRQSEDTFDHRMHGSYVDKLKSRENRRSVIADGNYYFRLRAGHQYPQVALGVRTATCDVIVT